MVADIGIVEVTRPLALVVHALVHLPLWTADGVATGWPKIR
jgi:hypothetical protein